jgi:hypothetical protein
MQTGLKRTGLEKFYTKQEIVEKCFTAIVENLKISFEEDTIIEPSCGNGSFIHAVKKLCKNYIFIDIEPENEEIEKKDFLSWDMKFERKVHIIGNPPFGRQSSLAKKFIKKSCSFANSISFILPKSFKKESYKKVFDLNFHLICEIDLPDKSFCMDGTDCGVPCVFQIWEKREEKRKEEEILKPVGFHFVKKEDDPDFCIRRVGGTAGNVSRRVDDKNSNCYYFIKSDEEDMFERFEKLTFEFNNTVGPKSISKQELIRKLNS